MPGKVAYISGPITGVENYKDAFLLAEFKLAEQGFIVLNPARLPQGMTNEQYMMINFAMINAADEVFFLPGWEKSRGAKLERAYCDYIRKTYWELIEEAMLPCG